MLNLFQIILDVVLVGIIIHQGQRIDQLEATQNIYQATNDKVIGKIVLTLKEKLGGKK